MFKKLTKIATPTCFTVRTRVPVNALAAVLVYTVLASASIYTWVTAALVHVCNKIRCQIKHCQSYMKQVRPMLLLQLQKLVLLPKKACLPDIYPEHDRLTMVDTYKPIGL